MIKGLGGARFSRMPLRACHEMTVPDEGRAILPADPLSSAASRLESPPQRGPRPGLAAPRMALLFHDRALVFSSPAVCMNCGAGNLARGRLSGGLFGPWTSLIPGKGRLKALPGRDPGQDWLPHSFLQSVLQVENRVALRFNLPSRMQNTVER
jgi:hypothetical protein